jgi:TatD DNase family protein
MIDVHTHLYMHDYDVDRDETIRRAFDAGMEAMIVVGTEPDDHGLVLETVAKDARLHASLGLHPHFFRNLFRVAGRGEQQEKKLPTVKKDILPEEASLEASFREAFENVRKLVKKHREKVVAIGECGLDYFMRDGEIVSDEEKALQKSGFETQILVSRECRLPVIVHARASAGSQDAYEDVFAIVRAHADVTFVLHCYMGDAETTTKFLLIPNVWFSFAGNITYPVKKTVENTGDDLRETVKLVPIERALTETDCPFLAPVPYRGKRNEPRFVAEVTKCLAEFSRQPHAVIEDRVRRNARKVFGI